MVLNKEKKNFRSDQTESSRKWNISYIELNQLKSKSSELIVFSNKLSILISLSLFCMPRPLFKPLIFLLSGLLLNCFFNFLSYFFCPSCQNCSILFRIYINRIIGLKRVYRNLYYILFWLVRSPYLRVLVHLGTIHELFYHFLLISSSSLICQNFS